MFVDASAIVAILTGETQRAVLLRILDEDTTCLTSTLAVFESAAAIARKKRQSIADSEEQVQAFLSSARIRIVALAEREGREALAAFDRYGKGRGHPAQLNMGDCFAYACARIHGVPLLFVGTDFPQTDIPSAMP